MWALARLACLCGVVIAAGAAFAQQETPPQPPLPNLLVARFPVPKHGDVLVVPVRIGAKTYQFLLDTGCTYSVVDLSLLPREPLETVKGTSASGKEEAIPLHRWPPAWLGDFPLDSGAPVGGVDLRKVREVTGYPIYGVIGMDFLGEHVVQVNFDKGDLRFYRWAPPDLGAALPIELKNNCPHVFGSVGRQRESFLVDTGKTGAFDLRREEFARMKKAGSLKVHGKCKATVLNDTVEFRYGQGKHLTLGEFTLREPLFSEGSYSLLGLEALAQFVVTFDFPGKKLYLQKGANYHRPNRWNLSGLKLVRRDGVTLVDEVKKGSAAAARGVKSGDVIHKVGRTAAEELSLFEIYTKLSAPDTTVRLNVVRGTKKRSIDLPLRMD
jgi:hypothetical protein